MTENKENRSDNEQTNSGKQVEIEPSEPEKSGTNEPGRTPGKAEGEDDESAES